MTLPKDPLEFFENLLQRRGLQSLHDGFKPSKEDNQYHDIWYNEDEMCRETEVQDRETGEKGIYKEFFKDYLEPILEDEVFEVRRRLVSQLDSTNFSRKKIVDNFIIRLKYFINKAIGLKGNDSSLIAKLPIIRQYLIFLINDIELTYGNEFALSTPDLPTIEDQGEKLEVEIVPFFIKEALPDFLKFVQKFFEEGDRLYLKELLELGNRPQKRLFFNGNANQLADAFKQMITWKLITQCNKTELIEWIQINFTYKNKGYVKAYNKGSLERIILTNDPTAICKNPLFKIIVDAKGDPKLIHIA